MIKNIIKFIQRNALIIVNKENYNSPLGRWTIDKCNIKTDLTSYYNNVDHCGSCDYNREYVKSINKNLKKENYIK